MRAALVSMLLALCLPVGIARADDGCHDLWFTRNLIYDRAGFCFNSVLGRAVFDNAGCTGTRITLTAVD